MAPNRMMSDVDYTLTQLGIFFVILLLAVDTINPVKIVMSVFPQILPLHIATVTILLILYVFISEMKEILYFAVKVFFHSILSIFFRQVEIIGRDNIPRYGPVIFTSNHANQFVDAVTILCTCRHKISYLVAEKSWNRRIIGDIAWAMGAVPVRRSQDSAERGEGSLRLVEKSDDDDKGTDDVVWVEGRDTRFESQIRPKDKIRMELNPSVQLKVISVYSDTSLTVRASDIPTTSSEFKASSYQSFEILHRVDQSLVYEKVLECLANGGTIGIFPEGGSHDRTDLLPLKVGVALIAYAALEKDGMNVPIVPVGLNYFKGHRFRGRAIVEFGRPVYIEPSTLKAYKEEGSERRRVCNELLERIEDGMRSVIVSTPDYETLQLIHTARRLYQNKETSVVEKQEMNRRFAEGYKQLLLMSKGNPPQEWLDLQSRIQFYQKELDDLGVLDYQIPSLNHNYSQSTTTNNTNDNDNYDSYTQQQQPPDQRDILLHQLRLPYRLLHLLSVLLLAALPTIFLNMPIGLLAHLYSQRRSRIALAKSKVKIKGMDVILSEKIVFCIVMVPTLWIFYGLCLWYMMMPHWNREAMVMLVMMIFPVFSYMGIMAGEAGMVDWKDLRPVVKRLFVGRDSRRRLAELPGRRRELRRDLRRFIKELGPSLGEVYYGKELDWGAHFQGYKEKMLANSNNSATAGVSDGGVGTVGKDKKEE